MLKDRIRTIRKAQNLTQKDFAARIGTTQNVLANYETGRRNPSASVINNICKTFRVNETWLRTGQGEIFLAADREQEIIAWVKGIFSEEHETFQKRFLSMLMELDDPKWNLLKEILEKIMQPLPSQSIAEEEITVSQAEAAYIKSCSKSVQKKASPVSNITADAANDK